MQAGARGWVQRLGKLRYLRKGPDVWRLQEVYIPRTRIPVRLLVTPHGEFTVKQAAEFYGLSKDALHGRLYRGQDVKEALGQ